MLQQFVQGTRGAHDTAIGTLRLHEGVPHSLCLVPFHAVIRCLPMCAQRKSNKEREEKKAGN
eukprot:3624045-Amphidinium_carterae.1